MNATNEKSGLTTFNNPKFGAIRVSVNEKGEPLFCLSDVCEILDIGNSRDVKQRLRIPGVVLIDIGVETGKRADGTSAVQFVPMNFINEPNLYRCIFQSRKKEAESFQDWIFEEVLPSIRKTGSYRIKPANNPVPRRYIRRGELINTEILNLLWLIGEYLSPGDRKAIALELGVSRQAVYNVLNGTTRSPRILQALYARARENREASGMNLYNDPREMRRQFLGECETENPRLTPVVYSTGKRGGQKGNQNARKGGGL